MEHENVDLSNNREVWFANANSTIQRTQYYPSGLPWAEGTGANEQNRKYNGKEFIEMHGYDTYDFHARMYMPALARTTTMDSMAENYYSQSPYSFMGNNPILNIDPTGMWYDDYSVDKLGNIKLEEKTDDDFDMLYTKSNWDAGNKKNGLKINDKSILTDLSKTNDKGLSISKDHTTGSIDDVFKVFKFASDNTNVEWALARYSNTQYAIWTNKDQGNGITQSVNSPKTVGLSNVNASLHSHPDILLQHERSSMGAATGGGYYPGSDWGNKIAGSRPYYIAVYFPDSKNIYSISKYYHLLEILEMIINDFIMEP